MFGPIGVWEMVIILVIALIVFGPRKLPELGRSLGKSLGEFKRASNELRNTLDEEIRVEERRTPKAAVAKTGPSARAACRRRLGRDGTRIARNPDVDGFARTGGRCLADAGAPSDRARCGRLTLDERDGTSSGSGRAHRRSVRTGGRVNGI